MSVLTVYLGAAVLGAVLIAENQWEIAGVLGLAGAVVFMAERRASADLAHAFGSRPEPLVLHVLVGGALVALAAYEDHFTLLMMTTLLVYSLACLGLVLQFGYAGVLNFAGAAFLGVGGYTAAVLGQYDWLPSVLVVLAGGLAAAAVGCLLVLPVLRTKGHYAAVITIAFGILFSSFLEVNDTLGGPQGLKVGSFHLLGWDFLDGVGLGAWESSYYLNYVLLALLLFALFLTLTKRLERSWIGLTFDAVREDEVAAATFGVEVARWRIAAFLMGNFVIGVSGALYGMVTNFVAPASFTFSDSLLMLAIVILGGIANPWGILPAAVLVVVVPEKLQFLGEYRLLLFAVLVVLVLRFRPAGLFPRALRKFREEVGR